jgi:hypothetical protein
VRVEPITGGQMIEADLPEVSYLLIVPTSPGDLPGEKFDLRLDS